MKNDDDYGDDCPLNYCYSPHHELDLSRAGAGAGGGGVRGPQALREQASVNGREMANRRTKTRTPMMMMEIVVAVVVTTTMRTTTRRSLLLS
jgi:hypothetical protein